jgi:tetratricopeptide (TPR) repeat protein
MWAYSLGSAYANTGDLDAASEQLEILRAIIDEPEVDKTRVTVTSVSEILTLAGHGLEGEIKEAKGDLEGAIASYLLAVELEDKGNYTEPPAWAQPMRHYMGAALLKAGNPEEAEKTYRRDLRWNAENGWSLYGLHESLADQGKTEQAAEAFARYEAAWKHSDTALTASRK